MNMKMNKVDRDTEIYTVLKKYMSCHETKTCSQIPLISRNQSKKWRERNEKWGEIEKIKEGNVLRREQIGLPFMEWQIHSVVRRLKW